MRRVRAWGLAQRVILVIGLALAFVVLGRYLVSLGHRGNFGWFAYAPLNSSAPIPASGMAPGLRVLVWLGLIAVWAGAGVWLLRPANNPASSSEAPAGPAAPPR